LLPDARAAGGNDTSCGFKKIKRQAMHNRSFPLLIAALFGLAGIARAERPLNVDDAGVLDRGGAKLEAGWSKDDETVGWEAAAGFAPVDNLELEVGLIRTRDGTVSPSGTMSGRGLAVKWVPLQSDTGLSAGLKYEFAHESMNGVVRTHALNALLSWGFAEGRFVHVNLGREVVRESGDSEGVYTWGAGFDWPVTDVLHIVAEVFGTEHSSPSRAVGLRYEIAEGVKVSGAIGRGNAGNFGNAGIAWEF
jgi:hypothetical protein